MQPWHACLLLLGLLARPGIAAVTCATDDTLTTSTALSAFLGASTGTMTLWFTPTGTMTTTTCDDGAGRQFLMGDLETYFALVRTQTASVCSYVFDGTGTHSAERAATADVPHHLVARLDGANLFLFVDGVSTQADGGTMPSIATNPFNICTDTPYSVPVAGTIHAAKTYAVTLSTEEIVAEASSHLMRQSARAPSGSWAFDACADGANANAVSFFDASGNAHPFTADDGANNTMPCVASTALRYPWGIW